MHLVFLPFQQWMINTILLSRLWKKHCIWIWKKKNFAQHENASCKNVISRHKHLFCVNKVVLREIWHFFPHFHQHLINLCKQFCVSIFAKILFSMKKLRSKVLYLGTYLFCVYIWVMISEIWRFGNFKFACNFTAILVDTMLLPWHNDFSLGAFELCRTKKKTIHRLSRFGFEPTTSVFQDACLNH